MTDVTQRVEMFREAATKPLQQSERLKALYERELKSVIGALQKLSPHFIVQPSFDPSDTRLHVKIKYGIDSLHYRAPSMSLQIDEENGSTEIKTSCSASSWGEIPTPQEMKYTSYDDATKALGEWAATVKLNQPKPPFQKNPLLRLKDAMFKR